MPLKAVIENLDEVPEALREEYTEQDVRSADGKTTTKMHVLNIEGIDSHPDVRNLKSAHERGKTERTALMKLPGANKVISLVGKPEKKTELDTMLERLRKIPDDFDPEEHQRIKDELEQLKARHGDDDDDDDDDKKKKKKDEVESVRGMLEQRIKNLEEKHRTDLAAKDEEIRKRDQDIERLVADERLTKALVESGVKPVLLKAAKAMHRSSVKVVKENGEYDAIVDTDLGPTPVAKFIADWASSDDGKEFVDKPKGSDAKGSDQRRLEENPWAKTDKTNPNMTKQGELIKEAKKTGDFSKVERLMKAANRPQSEINTVIGRVAA